MKRYIFSFFLFLIIALASFVWGRHYFSPKEHSTFSEAFANGTVDDVIWKTFVHGPWVTRENLAFLSLEPSKNQKMQYLKLTGTLENKPSSHPSIGIQLKKPIKINGGFKLGFHVGMAQTSSLSPSYPAVYVSTTDIMPPWEQENYYLLAFPRYPQDQSMRLVEVYVRHKNKLRLIHAGLISEKTYPQHYDVEWHLTKDKIELIIDEVPVFAKLDPSLHLRRASLHFLNTKTSPGIADPIYYSGIQFMHW